MSEALTVTRDRVVTLHRETRDPSGRVLESTRDGAPRVVLIGHGALPRALEQALEGRVAGDRVAVTLEPQQAYGPRQEGRVQRVSKKYFANPQRLRAGMVTALRTEQGIRPVTVVKVGGKVVDVDLNHPLAGLTLHFDVAVVDVREAGADEIAHGHVHGPGGHGH